MNNSRKEIIIVTISLGNDGAERVLTELSNEWIRQGHKVSVVQTGAGNYGCSYILSKEVELINIRATSKIKPIRYIQEINMLRRILRERKNAVAISFIVASIFILAMCKLFVGNRIIVSERNNPKECPAGKLQQKLRDLAFCMADVCVYQTEYAKNMFPLAARKKGVIIPNPINGNLPERFIGERRKAILTACRLHPQKNLPMLLDAFAMLHEDHPDYILEIYGQGDERPKLEEKIRKLKLEECVRMPGFADDIHKKMRDAAMFVSSSDYEGISNSMLEALGMGVPTVVTDCPVGGARMMIQDGVNGLLVPVADAEKMYKAMKRVIEEDGLAEHLSEEAVKIRMQLPIQEVSKKWIQVM